MKGESSLTCEVWVEHGAGEGCPDGAAGCGSSSGYQYSKIQAGVQDVHHTESHKNTKGDLCPPPHVEAAEEEYGECGANKISDGGQDCSCQPRRPQSLMHKGLTSLRDGDIHELQVGQTRRFHSYIPKCLQWSADTNEEEDADARE